MLVHPFEAVFHDFALGRALVAVEGFPGLSHAEAGAEPRRRTLAARNVAPTAQVPAMLCKFVSRASVD